MKGSGTMTKQTSFRWCENTKIMLKKLADEQDRSNAKMCEYLIKKEYINTFGIDEYNRLIAK